MRLEESTALATSSGTKTVTSCTKTSSSSTSTVVQQHSTVVQELQQKQQVKVQHATEQQVKQELVHQVQQCQQTGYNVSQWMTSNESNQVRPYNVPSQKHGGGGGIKCGAKVCRGCGYVLELGGIHKGRPRQGGVGSAKVDEVK